MKPKRLPSAKYLAECFDYDQNAGVLFWRHRPKRHFANLRGWRVFNALYAGKLAFTSTDRHVRGGLDGQHYLAHRIIWKMVNKKEPPSIIDHKDRKGRNNKALNLRAATHSSNLINKTCAWGVHGVAGIRLTSRGVWVARIQKDKRYIHIGSFRSREQALAARKEVEKNLYGDFAP